MRRRLIVIGLDGVPLGYLRQLMGQGQVPFLRHLSEIGSFGGLRSTVFPLSAIAWSASYTGKEPGSTGSCGFVRRREGSYLWEYVDPGERSDSDVWTALSEQGFRGIVVCPLFSRKPPGFTGVYVSGQEYGGQDNPYTAPEERQRQGDRLAASMERKLRLASRLLDTEAWDWAFVGLLEPDTYHSWYDDRDPASLLAGYQALDALLEGFLRPRLGDTSVLIYSDHGNRCYQRAFHINSWLYERGHLALVPRRERWRRRMNRLRQGVQRMRSGPATGASRWWRQGLLVAKAIARSSPLVQRAVRRYLPDLTVSVATESASGAAAEAPGPFDPGFLLDYGRTVAYAALNHGGNLGGILINRKGVDPNGVVPEGDYEAVRQTIATGLRRERIPGTNAPLVKQVWMREELFKGPHQAAFPDIVIELEDRHFTYISEDDVSRWNVTFDFRVCQHSMDGVLLCAGTLFRRRDDLPAHLPDIAPTIMAALGARIPEMDGRILPVVATDELEDRTGSRSAPAGHGEGIGSTTDSQAPLPPTHGGWDT